MEIRKLISKFLTQVCEKNYSDANLTLEKVIENKIKNKVKKQLVDKQGSKKVSKKEKESFNFKKGKNQNLKKVSKKGSK